MGRKNYQKLEKQYILGPNRGRNPIPQFGTLDLQYCSSLECLNLNSDSSRSEDEEDDSAASVSKKISKTKLLPIEISENRQCGVNQIGGWEPKPKQPIKMMNIRDDLLEQRLPHHWLKTFKRYQVHLADVSHPGLFAVGIALDPPPNDRFESKTWDEHMQKFYKQPEVAAKYKMRTLKPFSRQLYAIYDEKLKMWERIEVREVDFETQTVLVMHLDRILQNTRVPFDSLHELHPNYGYWHRYPLSCGLAGILSPNNDVGPDGSLEDVWSDECKLYFKNLVSDKTLVAFLSDIKLSEEEVTRCKVWLFNEGVKSFPEESINECLVQKGYAIRNGERNHWDDGIEMMKV